VRVGGARPPSQAYYVAVNAAAERADARYPLSLFHLYPICTRCLQHSVISHLLHLLPVFGLFGPGCRTALPKEGRTQLDILSEMGRGTSLDIYLGGEDQRSMDLDLLRTVASQARGFLSIFRGCTVCSIKLKITMIERSRIICIFVKSWDRIFLSLSLLSACFIMEYIF
jgi:hypothetical protein